MGTEEGKETVEEGVEKKEEKVSAAPEPSNFDIANPSRITPGQVASVGFNLEQRYVPVGKFLKPAGIVMLLDTKPDDPEDVANVEAPPLQDDEEEAEPPEPFDWDPRAP